MLRRRISAIMVIVFIIFIFINFIFSYSFFKFYKSEREKIDQEILREESEKVVEMVVDKSGEEVDTPASYDQRSAPRLHFHEKVQNHLDDTVTESEASLQTDGPLTEEQNIENSVATKSVPLIVKSRKEKRPPSNFTTTLEPKPEYYNSDEYYGDSNENLADKNYNNYDEGKFIVITSPGIQPNKNKLD